MAGSALIPAGPPPSGTWSRALWQSRSTAANAWRAQNGDHYSSSANFDGVWWDSGYVETIGDADHAFYAAARRAFCRKYLGKLGAATTIPLSRGDRDQADREALPAPFPYCLG